MGNKLIGILMVFIGAMGVLSSISSTLVTFDNIILNVLSRIVLFGASVLFIVMGLITEDIKEELQ